jgi:hypothetical protein
VVPATPAAAQQVPAPAPRQNPQFVGHKQPLAAPRHSPSGADPTQEAGRSPVYAAPRPRKHARRVLRSVRCRRPYPSRAPPPRDAQFMHPLRAAFGRTTQSLPKPATPFRSKQASCRLPLWYITATPHTACALITSCHKLSTQSH